MVWVIVNNRDQTGNIHFTNFELDMALSDPLPVLTFELIDINSTINLDFNQNIMLWDENAAPDHTINGVTIQSVPTVNVIADGSFNNAGFYWTIGGVNHAIGSIGSNKVTFTFSNTTGSGLANDANVLQLNDTNGHPSLPVGYVTPGQTYMFSVYVQGNSVVNADYYFQINWLDVNRNLLSSTVTGNAAPPSTKTRLNVSGVAPAGAAYAQPQVGAYPTVSGTNSGNITFDTLLIEPVWFPNRAMGNNAPISYPSPDCNFFQVNTIQLPDLSCARRNRLFYGYIADLEVSYEGKKRTWLVHCRPMGDVIENGGSGTPINASYSQQTDIFIINDIVTTYFSGTPAGGVVSTLLSTGQANSSQPLSTLAGTGQTIDSITIVDQTFREVMNNLCDITGFAYHTDPYMYVRYHPIPYDYTPFTLLSDPNNQPNNVTTFAPQEYTYIKDGTQIKNSVKVVGGQVQTTVQEQFSGNGSNKVFTLANTPVAVTAITIGGSAFAPTSANKIGIQGQDTNGAGGVVALMDATTKKVTFNSAPASGTNNVVITYTQNRPVSVLVEENTSIGKYGRRFVAKVTDTNLVSNTAAKTRGESEIVQWAFPVQNLAFKLSSEMGANWQPINMLIMPGTTILFTSALDNLTNQPFVIQTTKVTSPGGGINIYEYEAGVYRPKMLDIHRNLHKAVARNNNAGATTPVQVTYEVLSDNMLYIDSVTAAGAASSGAYVYGQAIYGYSSFL